MWQEGTWYYVEVSNSSPVRRGYISSLTNISGTVTTFNPTLATRYTILATENGEKTYQGPGTTYKEAGSLDALESVKFLSGNNVLAKVGDYAIIEYNITGSSQKKRAWFPHMKLSESAPTSLPLSALQAKFPSGKYWNHMGMTKNNQNSYTNSACTSHSSTATCNAFAPPGSSALSYQCMGFAEKCGFDSTLFNPRADANGWSTSTSSSSLSTLKAGDIVRYTTSTQHSIFVTAVNGDTVTYGDCNGTGVNCLIRWGATISKTTLTNNFVHKRSAPKTLV